MPVVIHPTAIIHSKAQLHPTVQVGPYAVIGEHVTLGADCQLGPHAFITGHTTAGAGNIFHAGCVMGDAPQDVKHRGEPTRLRIGDRNIFREHVTVHRSNQTDEETVIGSGNFLMAHSHVGHNCRIGDGVVLANGALLGGHVTVADRAFISGNCLVHQFVRIGTLALMQGGSAVSKDLPPFAIARGDNGMCGLNIVGLRRAGFSTEQRLELKRLYRLLFREGRKRREALEIAEKTFAGEPCRMMIEFVRSARRGLCADTGSSTVA
jgi:UDP-N-acetylglucosamine acyltransferase